MRALLRLCGADGWGIVCAMTILAHIKKLACALALLWVATAAPAKDVTVFAAASLAGALDEVAELSAGKVTISYAGSGLIARQVDQGAPADVIVLAHPVWMDWLDQRGHPTIKDTRRDIAANTLVLVGPQNASPITPAGSKGFAKTAAIAQRLNSGRIATGQTDAVPAGIYAKEWLQSIALWDILRPQLVETDNVRVALALVARGDVPFAITYRSDALSDPRVTILHDIDPKLHSPVTYPAAALTPQGGAFLELLISDQAAAIFARHGFSPLELN